jgi:putative ABC transport system ATP-binding protein
VTAPGQSRGGAAADGLLGLRLRGVVKEYPGGVHALRGVDLEIAPGELVAIVGPSGSGKTTLLQIMSTLDRPTSGDVYVDGRDVSGARDEQLAALRAHRIGFVFQAFHLLDGIGAVDNVANGLLYTGRSAAQRRARAREALERVGLGHRLDHRANQMSGGEQQRTAIARALVHDPRIIIADEPTGNLDPLISWEIIQLLLRINDLGVTVLMATHNADVVTSLRKRVVALEEGRVIRDEVGGIYHRVD